MAGKTIPEIYCWDTQIDNLNIYLASTRKGAIRISLTLGGELDCNAFFRPLFPDAVIYRDKQINSDLVQWIRSYLMNRPSKSLPCIDISCTQFQNNVLKAISRIPFGETRTYGEVAAMLGNPRCARAVGQVMRRNPLPIVFP